jgi:hypothetical protein
MAERCSGWQRSQALRLLKQRGMDPVDGGQPVPLQNWSHRLRADAERGWRTSPVLLLADALRVRPGRGRTPVRPCPGRAARLVVGDHFEGQFEGQNGASERLSEPVAACVS